MEAISLRHRLKQEKSMPAQVFIYERTAATAFEGVILPVIDPNLLLEKE